MRIVPGLLSVCLALTGCAAQPPIALTATPAALSHDTNPTFGFAYAGDASNLVCAVDGVSRPCAPPSITWVGLQDGTHRFTVAASDGSAAASYDWQLGTRPPAITLVHSFSDGTSGWYAELASDEKVAWSYDAPWDMSSSCDGYPTRMYMLYDAASAPRGATNADAGWCFAITATDAFGNVTSRHARILVGEANGATGFEYPSTCRL